MLLVSDSSTSGLSSLTAGELAVKRNRLRILWQVSWRSATHAPIDHYTGSTIQGGEKDGVKCAVFSSRMDLGIPLGSGSSVGTNCDRPALIYTPQLIH